MTEKEKIARQSLQGDRLEDLIDQQGRVERAAESLRSVTRTYLTYPGLQAITSHLLMETDYYDCPGARSRHHDYTGGNVVHTNEVLLAAINMARPLHPPFVKSQADFNVLVTAVIWHDCGKRWDYKVIGGEQFEGEIIPGTEKYDYTPHQKMIGHLHRSVIEFRLAVERNNVKCRSGELEMDWGIPEEIAEAIEHCILAHHGRPDWGSSVEPQTFEAFCLHFADMLSSRFPADRF